MQRLYKIVSGSVPASSLPHEALSSLSSIYYGDLEELKRRFPRDRFPRITGIGHLVESPSSSEPVTHYLTLLEKGEHGWIAARTDPR